MYVHVNVESTVIILSREYSNYLGKIYLYKYIIIRNSLKNTCLMLIFSKEHYPLNR